MPFLRFGRDKRGYETTSLLHAFRRQGRGQPRILYWFRSPASVKVGRSAFDEDAIRLIEEHHPDVVFDWPRILHAPGADADEAPPPPNAGLATEPGRGRERRRRREAAEGSRDAAPAAVLEPPPVAVEVERVAVVPAVLEPEDDEAEPVPVAEESGRETAAHHRFSLEDLERLKGRHAVLLRRIDEQVDDAEAAELLRSRAEALNPDTWVTDADVDRALEQYEQVYREIRDGLGPRRGSRR